jgi:hypothetical protein
MKKYIYLGLGLFLAAVLIRASQSGESRTLHVRVHYTGSGTVDAHHLIGVAIWNSPAFMEENSHMMPMQVKLATSKNGSVTFTNVPSSPVYVSAAYDSSGHWDGTSGPPPAGSSLGMYSKEPGKPEPVSIEPGKTATASFSFDDTVKMK